MEPMGCAREIAPPVTLPAMGTMLRTFAPQIFALLAGGLVGSLGMTYAARTERGGAALVKLNAWVFALACLALAGAGGAAALWQLRWALAEQGPRLEGITPVQLLLFGLVIGVPMSLPGVVFAWSDAHTKEKAQKKRRDFVPTNSSIKQMPVKSAASASDGASRITIVDIASIPCRDRL